MPVASELRVIVGLDGEAEVAGGLARMGSAIGNVGQTALGVFGGSLIAGALGQLKDGVVGTIGTFATFEQTMSGVGAVSNATGSQMQQLSALAIKLGQDTTLSGVGATDAARAMEELAKGGVSVADMMGNVSGQGGAVRGALLLASAGGIDFAAAATIAANAMTTFKLTGADVPHIADLFANAANKSSLEVTDLGESMKYIGPVAAGMGLSIDEVTAGLAELGAQGIKGSEAGTGLRTMLVDLAKPTKAMQGVLTEYNLQMFTSEGHMKSLSAIAGELHTKLGGLTDQQRLNALATLFGKEALSSAEIIYEQGAAGIDKWTTAVDQSGAAAAVGAARNNNLAGSVTQLKDSIETAAIGIGAHFAPVIRTAADELSKFVNGAMASPAVTKALDDLATTGSAALQRLIAKVSDPAFQAELKQWGTTAIEVGKSIAGLAGDIAEKLGPPLKAAADWFGGLDDQGRKNVVMFGLVAGAAVKFRDELTTLGGVVTDVIGKFAAKEAAKKSLQAANEGLAGSAAKTATAMRGVAAVAGEVGLGLAEVATVTGVAGAGAVGLVIGYDKLTNAVGENNDIQAQNVAHWNATSFAIANGATVQNNALGDFLRMVDAQGEQGASLARLSTLWNQYVAQLQASGQSTDTIGLHMLDLSQFITTTAGGANGLGSALTGAAAAMGATSTVATTLGSAFGVAATAISTATGGVSALDQAFGQVVTHAAPLPATVGAIDQAFGAVVISAGNMGIGLGTAANSMAAVNTAAANMAPYSVSAAAALNDLNTFGTAAAQGLNEAAAAAMNASTALSAADAVIKGLGSTAGTLQGYLKPLQAQWDALNVATGNGKHVTDEQAAAYAALAPYIDYLNAQIGLNKDSTLTATEAAIKNYQAQQQTGAAYGQAAAAAGASSGALGVSAAAATAAASAHTDLAAKIHGVPTSVTTTVDAASAIAAAGMMTGLRLAVVSVPTSINITASVDISGALGAIQTLRDNMPHSPAKAGPFMQLPDWTTVFDTFGAGVDGSIAALGRLGIATDVATADLQSKIAAAASAVAKAIADTLGAMKALAAFDFAANTPSGAQTSGLLSFVANTTAMFVEVGQQFKAEALKAGSDFADAAGKVLGLFANGVAAIKSLKDLAPLAFADVHTFALDVGMIVQEIGWVAGQLKTSAVTAAAAFSDDAGKVLALIGNGVKALADLASGPIKDVPFQNVHAFAINIAAIVQKIGWVASFFKEAGLAAAAAWADTAGKVIGIVTNGVAALLSLPAVVDPGFQAIHTFATSVAAVVQEIQNTATFFTTEGLAQASAFATGAGTVVGIIGNAVTGLAALDKFVAPSQTAIDNFVYAVYETVRKIAEMASQMSKEGIKTAGDFGVAAGSVFGALKNAIDVFTALHKLVEPSAKAIDDFAYAVAHVVERIGAMADQIGKDGIKKAGDFGTTVNGIFGALKTAMDTLTSLEKFKDLAKKGMDSFFAGVVETVQRMTDSTNQAVEFAKQASGYKANILAGVADVKAAQLALNTIGSIGGTPDLHSIGQGIGNSIVAGAQDALDSHSPSQVMAGIGADITAGLVLGMTQTQQDAAKAAADLASAVAKAVQDTLAAATALGGLKLASLPGAAQVSGILDFTRQLIGVAQQAAAGITTDALKAATDWADGASKIVALFSSGVDAIGKLAGYVQVGQGAIDNFGADLRTAINDLIFLSSEIATDLTTQAATWSESVGKAIAVYGTGADAFAKLRGYAQVGTTAIYAFGKDLLAAVGDLAAMVDLVGQELADRAGGFGEAVGKATGGIANAVAGMLALKGYARIGADAIYAFDKDLLALIADFAAVADTVGKDMLAGAGTLGDTIGKVTGGIATAVTGLAALKGYAGTSRAAMQAFVSDVRALTTLMVEAAKTFTTDGLTAAGTLADTAGKAVGILASGVTGFTALAAFVAPADATMAAFVATVRALVVRLVDVAKTFKADALTAAGTFADAGSKAVGLIGTSLTGFVGIGNFVAPARATVDGLIATIRYVIARFAEMAATMSTEGIAQTTAFGAATSAVLGGVGAAIQTFIALDTATVPKTGDLSDLVVAVQGVTRNMAAAAAALGTKAIADATAFGTAAQGIFSALKAGLDLFIAIDKPGGWPVTDWLQPLIELMSGVLGRGGQLLTQAQTLEGIASQFAASVGRSLALFSTGMNGGGITLTGAGTGGALIMGPPPVPPSATANASGGGQGITIQVVVTGNTVLGDDYATAAKLAAILAPELRRQLGLTT